MQETVKTAPLNPGCYIYRNSKGKVLYVGKAKVLRNRVRSYFNNFSRVEEKIRQMIMQAESVEFVLADSEIEALILESILIKRYKPKYNSMMVDDKSYAYVKFDKVKSSDGEYVSVPTISVTRVTDAGTSIDKIKQDNDADYFGPYPNIATVKRLLGRLRRIFPYCTGNNKVIVPAQRNQLFIPKVMKPCFHYQINLCNGACAGLVTRGEYESNLNKIKKFFKAEKNDLVAELEAAMKSAAKERNFEMAAKYRNMLQDIKYVGQHLKVDKDMDEVAIMQAKKKEKQSAINELIAYLQFPADKLKNHENFRVECYDISNIQGTNAVGAMTVSIDGLASPSNYRKFKIRMKNEPNDFAMMQEVLTRRFAQYIKAQQSQNRQNQVEVAEMDTVTDIEGFTIEMPKDLQQKLKNWKPDESFSQLPDLLIIDGGKGQLSSAYKILQNFGLADQVPIVGLAKREEEIFKVSEQFNPKREINPDDLVDKEINSPMMLSDKLPSYGISKRTYQPIDKVDGFDKVRIPRKSEALYLVQRVRDEAHRFGITFHRKLRSKSTLGLS